MVHLNECRSVPTRSRRLRRRRGASHEGHEPAVDFFVQGDDARDVARELFDEVGVLLEAVRVAAVVVVVDLVDQRVVPVEQALRVR